MRNVASMAAVAVGGGVHPASNGNRRSRREDRDAEEALSAVQVPDCFRSEDHLLLGRMPPSLGLRGTSKYAGGG